MEEATQAEQRRPPPEVPAPSGAGSYARADMLDEGLRIVDAARERGVVPRLLGGLAVRTYCSMIAFCERDYSDLDMAGLEAQSSRVIALFRELGYDLTSTICRRRTVASSSSRAHARMTRRGSGA